MLFSFGACGYGLLEIIWRGFTHWSMLLAGGLSFLGLGAIATRFKNRTLLFKAFLGSALITAIEFIFGVVFNIILKKNVWNYSKLPFNIKGQVCALYSFFWMIICLAAVPLADTIKQKMRKL